VDHRAGRVTASVGSPGGGVPVKVTSARGDLPDGAGRDAGVLVRSSRPVR